MILNPWKQLKLLRTENEELRRLEYLASAKLFQLQADYTHILRENRSMRFTLSTHRAVLAKAELEASQREFSRTFDLAIKGENK